MGLITYSVNAQQDLFRPNPVISPETNQDYSVTTPADIRELETEFAKLKVHGGRMNKMQMETVDQTV